MCETIREMTQYFGKGYREMTQYIFQWNREMSQYILTLLFGNELIQSQSIVWWNESIIWKVLADFDSMLAERVIPQYIEKY